MVPFTTIAPNAPVRSPRLYYKQLHGRLTWVLATLVAAIGFLFPGSTFAAEITVEKYCQLTLARLELVDRTWTNSDRPPTEAEQEALFQTFGTTIKEYLSMSSVRSKEIAGYLASNETLNAEIARLSAKIRDYIQKRSAP